MSDAVPERGEVWIYIAGSRQYRVVIISNEDYNALPMAQPWALAVFPDISAGIEGYAVPIGPGDPLPSGQIVIPNILRCTRSALVQRLGYLSERTYTQVEHDLRDFLALPS